MTKTKGNKEDNEASDNMVGGGGGVQEVSKYG